MSSTWEKVLCDALPLLCGVRPVLCGVLPVLCSVRPLLCDAVEVTDEVAVVNQAYCSVIVALK